MYYYIGIFGLYYTQVWIPNNCKQIILIRNISLVDRVFANCPGDLGSIPGRVIPKTLKMVLDTSLLNTQQYKVRLKGKVEHSKERSSGLPYSSVLKLLKRELSCRPFINEYIAIDFRPYNIYDYIVCTTSFSNIIRIY